MLHTGDKKQILVLRSVYNQIIDLIHLKSIELSELERILNTIGHCPYTLQKALNLKCEIAVLNKEARETDQKIHNILFTAT